jgi:hypothetical protein
MGCNQTKDHHEPDQSVAALAWGGVGSDNFVFPELRAESTSGVLAKPNFAICVSGGGFRATTLSLGWIRALHKIGVLSNARYLISNSGGSWFNTCFSYQEKVSNEEFLGPYLSPAEITPENSAKFDELSYAQVVSDASMLTDLLKGLVKSVASGDWLRDKDTQRVRAWSDTVGKAFLAKHGLGDPSTSYAIATSPSAVARAKATGVKEVFTACRQPSMPYPISVGCVMPSDDARVYQSFEFTPEYCGVPTTIADTKPIKLGGVLIEPFACSSKPPKAGLPAKFGPTDGPATVQVETPWVVPLSQQAGISSQFVAQNYASTSRGEAMWEVMACPEMYNWNGTDGQGAELGFCDGGGTDNMAIYPALRRGVESIFVGASTGAAVADSAEEFAAYCYDISGYFGRIPADTKLPQGIDPSVFNPHLQVQCAPFVQCALFVPCAPIVPCAPFVPLSPTLPSFSHPSFLLPPFLPSHTRPPASSSPFLRRSSRVRSGISYTRSSSSAGRQALHPSRG